MDNAIKWVEDVRKDPKVWRALVCKQKKTIYFFFAFVVDVTATAVIVFIAIVAYLC